MFSRPKLRFLFIAWLEEYEGCAIYLEWCLFDDVLKGEHQPACVFDKWNLADIVVGLDAFMLIFGFFVLQHSGTEH